MLADAGGAAAELGTAVDALEACVKAGGRWTAATLSRVLRILLHAKTRPRKDDTEAIRVRESRRDGQRAHASNAHGPMETIWNLQSSNVDR